MFSLWEGSDLEKNVPKYFWWPKLVPKFRCPNSVAKWFPKECAQNRWPKKAVYFGPHTSQKSALNYLGHTHLFFWSSWGTFWATIWGTYLGHKFGAQMSQIWGTNLGQNLRARFSNDETSSQLLKKFNSDCNWGYNWAKIFFRKIITFFFGGIAFGVLGKAGHDW